MEPQAVRELLGDIFVLSYDSDAGYPFRVAGTRVSALLGRDLKDTSFTALFTPDSRREIQDIVSYVAEEMLAAIAGITATAEDGTTAHLELLLLPFNNRAHARDTKCFQIETDILLALVRHIFLDLSKRQSSFTQTSLHHLSIGNAAQHGVTYQRKP